MLLRRGSPALRQRSAQVGQTRTPLAPVLARDDLAAGTALAAAEWVRAPEAKRPVGRCVRRLRGGLVDTQSPFSCCCPRWAGQPASTRLAPTASCAFGAPGPPRRPEPRSPSRTAATSTAAAAGNRYGPSIAATNPTRRRGCLRSAGAPGRKSPPGRHAASTSGDCRSGLGIQVVLAFGRGRSVVNVVGIIRPAAMLRRAWHAVARGPCQRAERAGSGG